MAKTRMEKALAQITGIKKSSLNTLLKQKK